MKQLRSNLSCLIGIYGLNVLLGGFLTAVLLAFRLVNTFAPLIILPQFSIPNLVLLSLAALLVEFYLDPPQTRNYLITAGFALVTFALLPLTSGLVELRDVPVVAIAGCLVFTVTTGLFDSIRDRLSTGEPAPAAPWVAALGLYLASQCFTNIFI